jgi:hypothetical protein
LYPAYEYGEKDRSKKCTATKTKYIPKVSFHLILFNIILTLQPIEKYIFNITRIQGKPNRIRPAANLTISPNACQVILSGRIRPQGGSSTPLI